MIARQLLGHRNVLHNELFVRCLNGGVRGRCEWRVWGGKREQNLNQFLVLRGLVVQWQRFVHGLEHVCLQRVLIVIHETACSDQERILMDLFGDLFVLIALVELHQLITITESLRCPNHVINVREEMQVVLLQKSREEIALHTHAVNHVLEVYETRRSICGVIGVVVQCRCGAIGGVFIVHWTSGAILVQ